MFDFETDSELDQLHWKCHTLYSLSKKHVTHGAKSLRMELYPSPYPGFNPKIEVNDWQKYKAICFDVCNPEKEETVIIIRIDDQKKHSAYANRYNKQFPLKPGPNRIRILLDSLITSGTHRQLNLKTIYKLIFFILQPQREYVL